MENAQRTYTSGTTTSGTTPSSRKPDQQDPVQQKVEELGHQTKEQVQQLADTAQSQALSAVASRKEQAAAQLSGIAEAFRHTSQKLQTQDQESVAHYTEQAAEKLDRLAHYVQERDVNELIGETERFARRQPELFLGGAFVLGLMAARFIKSSSERRERARWESYPQQERYRYETTQYPPARRTQPSEWETPALGR